MIRRLGAGGVTTKLLIQHMDVRIFSIILTIGTSGIIAIKVLTLLPLGALATFGNKISTFVLWHGSLFF